MLINLVRMARLKLDKCISPEGLFAVKNGPKIFMQPGSTHICCGLGNGENNKEETLVDGYKVEMGIE